jgi:uncharacterized protein DUF4394
MIDRLTRRLSRPLVAVLALALMVPAAALAGRDDDDRSSGVRNTAGLTFATVKDGTTLVVFDQRRSRSVPISGLAAGEKVVGIDLRPRNPTQLYGIGSTSQVYIIDAGSGTATKVGAGFAAAGALEGTAFGVDFNPAVDRIRIISNTGQNLRVNPDTGALVMADGRLKYAATDRNAGAPASGVGAGYTFAQFAAPPATPNPTTLYDIESGRDTLVTQVPPNDGTLNTVGRLGLDAGDQVGFDISGTRSFRGFGLFQQGEKATLHRVSLSSGKVSSTNLALAGSYDGLAVLNGYGSR